MNFDVNTLSTLMQLMGSQKPRESEDAFRSSNNAINGIRDNMRPQSSSQSPFAMQNGIGQRIDFEAKPEKKSQPTSASNPMSAVFDMMGGKGGNADMMSSLMPMFMNLMSKPAQVSSNTNKNESKNDQNFEQKLKAAMNEAKHNDITQNSANAEIRRNTTNDIPQNKQSNQVKTRVIHDKYFPISFAGYPLICSLNKLYKAKGLNRDNYNAEFLT